MKKNILGVIFGVMILLMMGCFSDSSEESMKEVTLGESEALIKGKLDIVGEIKIYQLGEENTTISTDEAGNFELLINTTEDLTTSLIITNLDKTKGAKEDNVVIKRGIVTDLGTITLSETGRITGKILLPNISDYTGIEVYLPGTSFRAKTDAEGNYTMYYVPAGTYYSVVIEKPIYKTNVLSQVVVTEGNETIIPTLSLDIDTGATGTISINNNSATTDNLSVNVEIIATNDARLMMISDNENFINTDWQEIETNINYVFDGYGEKTLYAKFINNNGIESAALSTSIEVMKKNITIVDTNLEEAIRGEIYKPTGNISTDDLEDLKELLAYDVSSLEGIEYLSNLTKLEFENMLTTDITKLSNLINLEKLHINNSAITNINNLSDLEKLSELTIGVSNISDISNLSNLNNLEILNLPLNQISDINVLENLSKIKSLTLDGNNVRDISVLSNFSNLRFLSIENNDVVSINNLTELVNLEAVYLKGNPLTTSAEIIINSLISKGCIVSYDDSFLEAVADEIELTLDKTEILADGLETVTLTTVVKDQDGNVMLGENVIYYSNSEALPSNTFATEIAGEYKFKAKLGNVESNELTLIATLVNKIVTLATDPISAEVIEGDVYVLPTTAVGSWIDGTTSIEDLTWDNEVNTSSPGTYIFNGTSVNTNEKAVFTLVVKPVIVGVTTNPSSVTVIKDSVFELPSEVELVWSDGTKTTTSVLEWGKNVDTTKLGTENFLGTVEETTLKVSFELTVNEEAVISNLIVTPSSAEVIEGSAYILPSTVKAVWSDGTETTEGVTWDNDVNTATSGTYNFIGTVLETSEKAVFTLTVTPVISELILTPSSAEVIEGSAYTLPSTVKAVWSNGTETTEGVTWDNEVNTSTSGTYNFVGTVSETAEKAAFTLIVTPVISELISTPSSAEVIEGTAYTLPSTVKAVWSDGTETTEGVTWDNEVNTSTSGTYNFVGTVSETAEKAAFILTVTPVITNLTIDSSSQTINKGDNFTLPGTAEATWSNNTTTNEVITWDKTVDTSVPGIHTFTGSNNKTTQTVTFTVTINDVDYEKYYNIVYLRGTFNNWITSEMNLVADNTWELEISTGSSSTERFKFDIYGDWSKNFGDNNNDKYADQGGSDIKLSANKDYVITFNDTTKEYSVVEQ